MAAYKFEITKDAKGEFRFRFVAPNGQVMFTSGEGYSSKSACEKSVESIKEHVAGAEVVEK